MPIRRRHYQYSQPVQYQRPVAPAAQPTVRPAPTQAAAPGDRATLTPAAPPQSGGGVQGLINGIGSWAGGGSMGELLKASRGVQLTPEERAQVQQAAGVMQRLAGADGMWNRGDLRNNVNQLERSGDLNRAVNSEINRRWGQELNQRGRLGRALVNGHMRRNYGNYQAQGMNQARGMANQQLARGMDGAGIKGNAGHQADKTTPEGLKKSGEAISRGEIEQMQKTMDMLKEKSAAQGLPEVQFPNGVPAQFLKDIAEGKSPQQALKDAGAVLKLKNGQSVDLSKMPGLGGDKAAGAAADAAKKALQQAGDAFKGLFGGGSSGGQNAAGKDAAGQGAAGAKGEGAESAAGATGEGAGGTQGAATASGESAGETQDAAGTTAEGTGENALDSEGAEVTAEGEPAEEANANAEEAGAEEVGETDAAAEPEPEPEPEPPAADGE